MKKNSKNKLYLAVQKSAKALFGSLPILIAVLLLTGLLLNIVPEEWFENVFHQNVLLDSLIGATAGSLLTGNPTSSYVLGGELLQRGVSLAAVTAFVVSWVSVGVAQFPAESIFLGKRFSIWRNILSFVMAILVGLIVYYCAG